MGKLIDMTGRVCGQLTVLEQAGKTSFGQIQWRCRCSCGTITIVDGGNLRTRHTVSCGCTMNVTHGEARPGQRTPEYIAWKNMLQRCRDINNKDYGARGITVFPPWKRYEKFLAYLLATIGRRPSLLLSIDRIDNDRGY